MSELSKKSLLAQIYYEYPGYVVNGMKNGYVPLARVHAINNPVGMASWVKFLDAASKVDNPEKIVDPELHNVSAVTEILTEARKGEPANNDQVLTLLEAFLSMHPDRSVLEEQLNIEIPEEIRKKVINERVDVYADAARLVSAMEALWIASNA
jgi:hypothetical protein